MKMQNQFHKELDNDLELDQYISENCHWCKEELIRVKDIFVGKEDNNYYCEDCKDYHKINVFKCKDINY